MLVRYAALGEFSCKENRSGVYNIKLYRAIRLFILWELKNLRISLRGKTKKLS